MNKFSFNSTLGALACIALLILALVSLGSDHWIVALLFGAAGLYLFYRLKQNTEIMVLLEKTKRTVAAEDAIKAAREAIIDLHLHAPDRTYFLARIDQATSQKAFFLIVEEARTVATKHPLGMNI